MGNLKAPEELGLHRGQGKINTPYFVANDVEGKRGSGHCFTMADVEEKMKDTFNGGGTKKRRASDNL